MILIGLAGPPGAGKNTVAAYLGRHGFIRWSFGASIERHKYLRANGSIGAVAELDSDENAGLIREQGGQAWLIQRPSYLTHAGDAYRGITPQSADRDLLNDGPIAALYNRVDKLLDELADEQIAEKQAARS